MKQFEIKKIMTLDFRLKRALPVYHLTNNIHSHLDVMNDDKQSWESIEKAAEEEAAKNQPTINLANSKQMITQKYLLPLIITVVVVIILLAGIVYWIRRRKQKRRSARKSGGSRRSKGMDDGNIDGNTKHTSCLEVRYPDRVWQHSEAHSASLWSGSNG